MNRSYIPLPASGRIRCLALLLAAACLALLPGLCGAALAETGPAPFDYAALKGMARSLAQAPYADHEGEVPEAVDEMTWDQFQAIHFNKDHALWRNRDSKFQATLFHLGLYFKRPVAIYELVDGKAERIRYDGGLFDYGKSGIDPKKLPGDMGFAGFRMQFAPDWERDVVAFLGASYFRAVGKEMQYGLSARGLAVDTALSRPEEFPVFTAFWLERPRPGSDTATVYALLDSPSVTGAYRFDITPGDTLTMRVDAALYPRKPIERLGIAPLTSMFMVGENDRRTGYDWRPEIHDSDGLALHTGTGQWIWRPLNNPRSLRFNAYMDDNPRGFGLLQRDQNFDHYQDDGVYYDKRPGLWVAPRGDWGKGAVELVEIPALDETFDNIVAFWHPARNCSTAMISSGARPPPGPRSWPAWPTPSPAWAARWASGARTTASGSWWILRAVRWPTWAGGRSRPPSRLRRGRSNWPRSCRSTPSTATGSASTWSRPTRPRTRSTCA
jgi:glucans biosynthesis protein